MKRVRAAKRVQEREGGKDSSASKARPPAHLLAPARLVLGDHLLEVIHVVGAHRRELVAFRLDVPRHRNVDDSQPARARLAPPLLHQLSLRHDAPRGGG